MKFQVKRPGNEVERTAESGVLIMIIIMIMITTMTMTMAMIMIMNMIMGNVICVIGQNILISKWLQSRMEIMTGKLLGESDEKLW